MFASIVSSITSLLSGLNSHAKKFETTSDRLDEVMRTEEFPKALQARAAIYTQSSTVPAQPVEPTDYSSCAIAQCHCSSLRRSLNSRSVRRRFDDSSRWRSFHIVAQFKLREHISDVAKLSSGHNLPVRCCKRRATPLATQYNVLRLQRGTICCACNAVQCVALATQYNVLQPLAVQQRHIPKLSAVWLQQRLGREPSVPRHTAQCGEPCRQLNRCYGVQSTPPQRSRAHVTVRSLCQVLGPVSESLQGEALAFSYSSVHCTD